MRLGVLSSHNGTVFQAIIDAVESGSLGAELVLLVSNNSNSGAVQRAVKHGISWVHLSSKTHPGPGAMDSEMAGRLTSARADCVFLAGYMKKLGPTMLRQFGGRILNTHPALLPSFGGQGMFGSRVHEAVVAAGEETSGVTIHLVDGDYDTGAILAQREVPVLPEDDAVTLAARVQAAERPLVVETLTRIALGKLRL